VDEVCIRTQDNCPGDEQKQDRHVFCEIRVSMHAARNPSTYRRHRKKLRRTAARASRNRALPPTLQVIQLPMPMDGINSPLREKRSQYARSRGDAGCRQSQRKGGAGRADTEFPAAWAERRGHTDVSAAWDMVGRSGAFPRTIKSGACKCL